MGDRRERQISNATDELRKYAGMLDGYQQQLADLEPALNEGRVTAEMWGVHTSIEVLPSNPNADEPSGIAYGPPDAPAELRRFRTNYEAAHDALTIRLRKIARAIEHDAYKYGLIADHYDEDERENLADIDKSTGQAVIPRSSPE